MALVKTSDNPRDLTYASIRTMEADKSSNTTIVNVGLFFDAADRWRDGVGAVPAARDAQSHILTGYGMTLADIYTALAALPEWAGWGSDEQL